MRDLDVAETVDERVARLEEQMQALLGVVADQAATIEAYERGSTSPTRHAAVASEPVDVVEPERDRTMNRRRLLLGGATATAAAAAAVVAGSATPAAAANGGALIMGQTNTATAETKLSYGANINNGFRVEGQSDLAMIEGYQTGTGPGFKGMNAGNGVGVEGSGAAGTGVYGYSSAGDGVSGRSNNTGAGVRGSSFKGPGIVGESVTDSDGNQNTSPAIVAKGFSGNGLEADTVVGYAIRAEGGAGALDAFGSSCGINVRSPYGPAIKAYADEDIGIAIYASIAHLRLQADGYTPPPMNGTLAHQRGDLVRDDNGDLWLCTTAGTPGAFRKLAGPTTAGAFHVLPAPARVYDSRPNTAPGSVGPKTKFAKGTTRTFDLKVNNSKVPAGATAALLTVLLVNASNADGNLTVWANGIAKPAANTMVWGGSTGRFTASAVTALDSQARIQVNASAATDLVLDVVGYYR